MNDRELLEGAARAIGAKPYVDEYWPGLCLSDDPQCLPFFVNTHGSDARSWDPLNDDGDALRLAIEIGLIVNTPSPIGEYAIVKFYDIDVWERVSDCRYAATRRAIVRAAAEIGSRVDAQPESVG